MITQSIYNVAKAQADGLKNALNMKVVPGARSILSTLIDMSYVTAGDQTAVRVEEVTSDSPGVVSAHSGAVGTLIDQLTPVVESHILFIQNQVNPKVDELYGELEKYRETAGRMGPASMFDIRTLVAPASVDNSSLRSMIEDYAQEGVTEPVRMTTLPAVTYEDLLGWMATSNGTVDAEVREWLATLGEDWLMNVWAYYFASSNATVTTVPGQASYKGGLSEINAMPSVNRVELTTALFLISRGLLSVTLDADVGMSLNQWRANMDAYSRISAAIFKNSVKMLDMYARSKTLILNVDENGRSAVVYGPVYNAWLSDGNSVDIIFGAILSGKARTYTVDDLNEGPYYAIWSNFEKTQDAVMRQRIDVALRAHALGLLRSICYKFSEEEESYFENSGAAFNGMMEQASEWLEKLTPTELDDTMNVAIKLVAGFRYKHTPAFQFMSDMHQLYRSGCKDPREAASLAAINYLSDYLSAQLALVWG